METARFELGEIVVTASKTEEQINDIPKNVTIITNQDIEQATSNSIVDLLARESGINLRSSYGHDKWAGIDIRGMGDTHASNVIVMLNGVRLNPPDMAGPDLASISLDQVERIEIIRGAGSVMYGNGAVGGVINIITKKGTQTPHACLFSSWGSYDTKDLRTSFSGSIKNLSLNGNAAYYDTHGYRDNGGIEKRDASLNTVYGVNEDFNLMLNVSIHEDTYGLPGPVEKGESEITYWPEDSGDTMERRYTGGVEIDLGVFGLITAQRGYRFRKNRYIMGYNPMITARDQTNRIDEDIRDFYLNYTKGYSFWGQMHRLKCGIDHYETEYIGERYSGNIRNNCIAKNLGFYFANDLSLTDEFMFRLGYRSNLYKDRHRIDDFEESIQPRWINGDVLERKWVNDAYDAGLVYFPSQNLSLFTNLATSFRIPNIDELAGANGDLHPQEGIHLEFGIRQRVREKMEISITHFRIKIDDEIYYGQGANRNYDDKTLRRGLEADIKLYPMESLYLWGNYTFVEAMFEKRDTFIPLVPKHKSSIGLEWQFFDSFLLGFTGTFVGPCFDGDDKENNIYEKLGGYEVMDVKFTYIYKCLRLFLGMNNCLDEYYSTLVYSQEYYPMPGRNIYGGMKWGF
ncbi:TonB-dependent receptor [bacterium]|nr:TonB-dependent receptor [bacterium]